MVDQLSRKFGLYKAKAIALLKEHHLKLTAPRKGIIALLMEQHGPFTIEELHQKMGALEAKEAPDLATIYRTMTRFEELRIVNRCDFGDGTLRFELAHLDHHHHHIVCRKCRIVTPLDPCTIDLEALLPKNHGFQEVSHKLEFFGLCPKCQPHSS